MIKAVIFDIGGVILNMDKLILSVKKTFNPSDMDKFWQDLNEKFSPLCRGEGTLLDFWKELAKTHGKSIPESKLKKLWIEDFEKNIVINNEVKKIILSLKKNYKLAIISNVIQEHGGMLKKNESFSELHKLFDVVTFSYEVKMSKDSKDIFLLTLKKLKLKPKECVFTDDTEKFVDVANSLGIHGIVFKNAEQFKEDLRKLNINV